MRVQLLTLGLLLTGCSLYAPAVPDCSLSCAEDGSCPSGLRCDGTYCRPRSAEGTCECRAQESRPCGSEVGECSRGIQVCSARGAWGECQGAVGPGPEVCDGLDNDCDGLVDKGPLVQLADDHRGPFALFGFDGGYGLLYGRAPQAGDTDAGLVDVVVARYDTHFAAAAPPELLASSVPAFAWASSGAVAFIAYGEDGGLEVRASAPGAPSWTYARLPGAEVEDRLQLGAGERLRATWRTPDAGHLRLARWHGDGGLEDVVDLDGLDAGLEMDLDAGYGPFTPDGVGLTDQGHVAFFSLKATAAGHDLADTFGAAVDTETLAPLGHHADFGDAWYRSRLQEKPWSGRVAATMTDGAPGTIVYHCDDAIAGANWSILAWTVTQTLFGFDSAVRPRGDVIVVVAERSYRRLTFVRVVEDPLSTTPIVSKYELPPSDGFGAPRLAQSGSEQMLGLAFSENGRISARPICGIDW